MRHVFLCVAALFLVATPLIAAERPNFVFIYTDDQRWDALGCVQREQGEKGRFPWLKTPNLDRLAAEGIRFRNAFVVNALCAPSRATYLTGCYGHINGIVNNHTPFAASNVTHATLLRQAGYVTGYVGKWHMGPQRGQRPGFDYSASFVGQGRYVDCPIEVNGKETPSKGWVDDVSTDYAIQFLREHRAKPFALVVGLKAAHGPFDPPTRYKDLYAGEEARVVPNMAIPAIYNRANPAKPAPTTPTVPTNLGYFRCLTAADDNVGRLLKELDALHLTENTMVVYASDNGFYLGEHQLGDKRSAYEESLRIPLLVRYPRLGKKGRIVDQMALNVDLAPTFLDYAGLPIPKTMQGRSWRPLLEEKKDADWRKAFFYCYFYERNFRIPTVTAVRTEQAKLIRYPDHPEWTEVFDLRTDPYEMKNLANDANRADLRRELEAEYDRQKQRIDFRIPDFADDPKPPTSKPGLRAWVLDYRFDKDEGTRVVDATTYGNHGTAHGVPLVAGREGRKARRFDGKGHIDIPKTSSLDPAVDTWSLEITFKAESKSGILLASGGRSQGYAVSLDEGRPVFTVVVGSRMSQVKAQDAVQDWTTVLASASARDGLVLTVNGKPAGRTPLPTMIERTPNDATQIGADLGSQVTEGQPQARFIGWIEMVRIFSGQPESRIKE